MVSTSSHIPIFGMFLSCPVPISNKFTLAWGFIDNCLSHILYESKNVKRILFWGKTFICKLLMYLLVVCPSCQSNDQPFQCFLLKTSKLYRTVKFSLQVSNFRINILLPSLWSLVLVHKRKMHTVYICFLF